MRYLLLNSLLLLGAACSREIDPREERPSVADVDRLEAQLAGRPCIGPLDQWSRVYRFGFGGGDYAPPNWGIERNRITFEFSEAGIDHFRSGRRILGYGGDVNDRQMRVAFGDYDILSGRITIHHCGLNQSPDPPGLR